MGSGPNVICLHGWGGSTDSFLGLARSLSEKYTVYLVDFNGFGLSPEPSYPFTLDNYVSSIAELARYYRMESFSLVCHSFGGRVGIKFCYKFGYMVDKLILVDSAGMKPRRSLRYYYAVFRHKLLKLLRIKHESGSCDYKKLSPVMKKTFVSIVNEHLEEYAEHVKVPTILIWGNKDKETPVYMGKRLLRLIKGSEMIVFEGCGHFSYLERHFAFVSIVKAFLSGELNEVDSGVFLGLHERRRIVTIPDPFAKR